MVKSIFAVVLFATSINATAAGLDDSAVIKDNEGFSTLAMGQNTWSYVAASKKGMSKVREFYDMGDAGVQQLDYVVNCTNEKLALASFKVLTTMNTGEGHAAAPSFGSVSFYKPVIQHDMNIVDNVCGSRVASTAAIQTN